MPAKHPVKERAWGTRYDTLKSSPSSSSVQTSPVATTASQHSPIPKSSTATASDDEKPEDAEQVPSVAVPKLERPHNDNSIFVGSLPTHIDPTELTYMLTQHFAEYAQVKDVKAVRDVIKGSVCAFLTCENATAASQLLKTLQETPPKPFQGRTLRFEFARASRTLVVSYRVPSHLVYPNSGLDGTEPDAMSLTSHRPSAMRIYRPQNSKHTAVLYDSDALNFEAKATSPLPSPEVMNASTSTDKLSGSGVLIEPLNYDSETLHKIALAFGPIELFGPFIPNRDGGDSELLKSSNSPADAAHSLDMGEGPWEVKWQHRDDCVNASMTLRRIPHLSVNWAHHLNNDGQTESRFASPSGSPGPFHSMPRMRHLSRSVVHPESDYKRLQDHLNGPFHLTSSTAHLPTARPVCVHHPRRWLIETLEGSFRPTQL
ncbi:hypothetical protein BC835DRAFT_775037 [Cytidiella melzeri]|nr:hypothetical protein BC835DRAFT_775037 [Cytidiella melzeri]